MKLMIYTRSMNDEYYQMMTSLLPKGIPLHRVTGMNHWSDASKYLYEIIEHAYINEIDYAINIDEDCFVYDWDLVEYIIQEMIIEGYTHAGMPDGGCHVGRLRSYKVHNPFFNVFKVSACYEVLNDKMKWTLRGNDGKPDFNQMPYEFDVEHYAEPFDEFFTKLNDNGYPYFLYGDMHEDGISTILKCEFISFALHTWYSRDASHRDRIIERFEEAKQLSNGNK